MIHNYSEEDFNELNRIHKEFYSGEFNFADFLRGSFCNFVIRDDTDGKIVTAGSIRPIAEMIAITNKHKSPRLRRAALYDALQIASHTLRGTSMDQLHAFVQDTAWEAQLIRSGFKRTVGNALYINL